MVVKFDWDPRFAVVLVDQTTLDGLPSDWTVQVKMTSEPYTTLWLSGCILTAGNIKDSKIHKNIN